MPNVLWMSLSNIRTPRSILEYVNLIVYFLLFDKRSSTEMEVGLDAYLSSFKAYKEL